MAILFTQYWDVMPGKFDEYSSFVTHQYNPALEKLGIKLVGGYYVAVGEGPRIVAVATVDDTDNLRKALSSRDYRIISNQLLSLVWKYSSKVWLPTGRIQEGPYRIQTGVWKFNQLYNILRGKEEDHRRFVKEECIPGMEELKVPITGGWRMIIGSGPRILAECTGRNLVEIAQAIDSSLFRKLVRTLKNNYATDFSSKILAPTGRVEVPYLMSEMMKKF
ncbi:MAG: hypothetical protein MUF69_13340 [Desulfobacterota bacterium]|jgi:hypothetical protein|nr:hypothetical protein [Thermodesulfobacteriota bacterium]